MSIVLKKIELSNFSDISFDIKINEECTTLYSKFSGEYKPGSLGNKDGLFMFSKLTSTYFIYETIVNLIIDLSELKYSEGNTLLKSLNFFAEIGRDQEEKEKQIFVLVSKTNRDRIESVLNLIEDGHYIIFDTVELALEAAEENTKEYLDL